MTAEKITQQRDAVSYAHHENNHHGDVHEDRLDPNIRDDHGDPHRAALEATEDEGRVTKSTWAAVVFLGFTFQPSLSFTIYCCFPILVRISILCSFVCKS